MLEHTLLLADGEEDEVKCGLNPVCHALRASGEHAASSFQTAFADFVTSILEGVGEGAALLGTAWFYLDTGTLISFRPYNGTYAAYAPAEDASNLVTVMGWVAYTSLGLCVLSLMLLGGSVALRARRGEGGEYISKIGMVLVASILIGSASGIAGALLGIGPSTSASGPVLEIQRHLWWYVGAFLVLSVIIAGARIAWEQRAEPAKELLGSLFTMVVISGASVGGIGLLITAGDSFAKNILFGDDGVVDADFGAQVLRMLGVGSDVDLKTGAVIAALVGCVALFATIVQAMLLLIRDGILLILVAVLPLAASITNTAMGKQFLTKLLAWILAFLLYKPAAAIIYAMAFEVFKPGDDEETSLIQVILGLVLMLLSLIALPALMRLVVPAASMGGGNTVATGLSGAAGFVSGSIASGAIDKFSQEGSDASSSGNPSGNPSSNADMTSQGSDQGPAPGQEGGNAQGEESGGPTGNSSEGSQPQDTGGTQPTGQEGGTQPTGQEASSGGDPYTMIAQRVKQGVDSAKETGKELGREGTGGPDGHQ